MGNLQWWLRSQIRRLNESDLRQRVRFFLSRHSPRKVALILCGLLFFFYCLFSRSNKSTVSIAQLCIDDKVRLYSAQVSSAAMGVGEESVYFVGNGFLGVGNDNELRLGSSAGRLSLLTGFRPLVHVKIPEASDSREVTLTDFEKGIVKRIKCFQVENECACVMTTTFAHRTKPNLLIEDVQIVNPTHSSLQVTVSRPASPEWTADKSAGDSALLVRELTDEQHSVAAVVCTTTPSDFAVRQKREESMRLACSVAKQPRGADADGARRVAVATAVAAFNGAKAAGASITQAHEEAWNKLNLVSFHLSPSLAPQVLHGVKINATRYVIVSNSRAPLLEEGVSEAEKKQLAESAVRRDLCYTGHSTMLFPSRLWEAAPSADDIIRLADIWLLTLEKRGCATVMKTGATGIIQAYVLSLAAGTFHDGHLEIGLDPSELHREMSVKGLEMGDDQKTKVNVDIELDSENRPYFMVSASSTSFYACDAGCMDEAVQVGGGGHERARLPVKITKPLTSILYLAASRKHLTQLRSAIHVSEVDVAPANEHEVIALHRHGARLGGLPTPFWIFLGAILVAFHVFLIKLLYSEWRKGDTTPYNPYLRQRYSYIRSH